MFHIVFNADQNYMKYVAVLITNIIHYTDTSKKYADFAFHSTESKINPRFQHIYANKWGGGGAKPHNLGRKSHK
ncbi:hypothetical protein [Helicobacter bilis]|uniref:hypothetical protein n=1 Tax=Helicobacter bilis TaxID=37372 RepID=UPI0026EEB713|nr:hypothetical protein [Helicobacter bilis]MCI7411043.1 hypothetical protein [Helicobacter bilis]MDY4400859.1 hypothetical protein [Helicobacter bilis]